MRWLKRVRAAVVMGLTWAVLWAPVGVLVGLVVDPDGSMDEMWPAIGAYPGFLCGIVFSGVLVAVARHRRLHELSLSRFAAWGAVAGAAAGVLPFLIGEPAGTTPVWLLGSVVVASFAVMSGASAAASLALARRAERRALLDAGQPPAAGIRTHASREPLPERR